MLLLISITVYVLYVFLIGFGSVLLIYGVYSILNVRKLKKQGHETTGEIVDYKKEITKDKQGFSQTIYFPVVRFVNEAHKEVDIKYNIGSSKKKKYNKVKMWYLKNPENENEYDILLDDKDALLFPVVFLFLGVLMLIVAVLMFMFKK